MKLRPKHLELLLLPCGLAVPGLFYATRHGIGLSHDSVIFILGAMNIAAGRGFSLPSPLGPVPITHFPPLLPGLIALFVRGGFDAVSIARGLNIVFFGAMILLVTLMAYWYSEKSIPIGVATGLLTLTSFDVLYIHSMAWTEPLCFFCGFLGLCLLTQYLVDHQTGFLIGSALSIALAILTRYAAIAFWIAGVLGILLLSRKQLQNRIGHALIFSLISILPLRMWTVLKLHLGNTLSDRMVAYHPSLLKNQFATGMSTMSIWLLQGEYDQLGRIIGPFVFGTLFIFSAIFFHKRRSYSTEKSQGLRLLFLFSLSYLFVVGLTIAFYDPKTTLDSRILSPVHISILIMSLCGLYQESIVRLGPRPRRIFSYMGCLYVIFFLFRGMVWIQKTGLDGQEYASSRWKQSQLLGVIRSLPSEIRIYTNASPAVYLYTTKIPFPINGIKPSFHSKSIIAYFHGVESDSLPSSAYLEKEWALRYKVADGVLYDLPAVPAKPIHHFKSFKRL